MTQFQCIADRCEDTCCSGLKVVVEREDVANFLEIAQKNNWPTPTPQPNSEMWVLPKHTNGNCAYLDAKKYCGLETQGSARAMPGTCKAFPRVFVDGLTERMVSATFSCPEAARLCLLKEGAADLVDAPDSVSSIWPKEWPQSPRRPYSQPFEKVNSAVVELLQNRSMRLSERMANLVQWAQTIEEDFHTKTEVLPQDFERTLQSTHQNESQTTQRTSLPLGLAVIWEWLSFSRSAHARFQACVEVAMQRAFKKCGGEKFQIEKLAEHYFSVSEKIESTRPHWSDSVFERYAVNEWYRDPYVRSTTVLRHLFELLVRMVSARWLWLENLPENFTPSTCDETLIQAVQVMTKYVEQDRQTLTRLKQEAALGELSLSLAALL